MARFPVDCKSFPLLALNFRTFWKTQVVTRVELDVLGSEHPSFCSAGQVRPSPLVIEKEAENPENAWTDREVCARGFRSRRRFLLTWTNLQIRGNKNYFNFSLRNLFWQRQIFNSITFRILVRRMHNMRMWLLVLFARELLIFSCHRCVCESGNKCGEGIPYPHVRRAHASPEFSCVVDLSYCRTSRRTALKFPRLDVAPLRQVESAGLLKWTLLDIVLATISLPRTWRQRNTSPDLPPKSPFHRLCTPGTSSLPATFGGVVPSGLGSSPYHGEFSQPVSRPPLHPLPIFGVCPGDQPHLLSSAAATTTSIQNTPPKLHIPKSQHINGSKSPPTSLTADLLICSYQYRPMGSTA